MPNDASNFRFQWRDSVIDLKMPYMSITVQYIKTHTVVLWFAVYSVRILVRRRHHGCLCTTVSIVLLKPICVMQCMFVRASAADSRSLVAVAVKQSWSFPIQLYWTCTRTVNIHKRQSATKRKLQLEAYKKET